MARVDDVVFNYLHLPRNAVQNECIKGALEDAVRYGFQQGESFGKYARYIGEVNEEIAREIFQEPKTKKIQTVIRVDYEYHPKELERALEDGWLVERVTPMGMGKSKLEYILEKEVEIDGRTETVKIPEDTNGKEAERN